MYRVRFHLGRGIYFRYWQVSSKDGVVYYNPNVKQLILRNCTLISQPKTARKVFESGKKNVCGWIKCATVIVNDDLHDIDLNKYRCLRYNPVEDTDWRLQDNANSVTGLSFPELITKGNRVYCHDENDG